MRKKISNSLRKKYFTTSPFQTKKLGETLAREISRTRLKKGALVIGLEGNLAGGKTTFLQGFARGLGIKEKILSPTFVIVKRFKIPKKSREKSRGLIAGPREVEQKFHYRPDEVGNESSSTTYGNFYHIDCYRVKRPKEILDLGFKEIITSPRNIVCIEWAERIKKILPKETFWLKFEFKGKNQREIIFKKQNLLIVNRL